MATLDEPVRLEDYDRAWPDRFTSEEARLRKVLGRLALGLEHIGSTAVPGLVAKPIIDIMVGVAGQNDAEATSIALQRVGYEHVACFPGRQYLRRREVESFNAHVVVFSDELWRENLAFRDYLRAHPDAARSYAQAKREAAAAAPMLVAYSELKEPHVEELLRRARAR